MKPVLKWLQDKPLIFGGLIINTKSYQTKKTAHDYLNPFTPTGLKTFTHFRWFLKVLEYSPIDVKILPITAQRTLYTVKKLENFQYIFGFESLNLPN
jgi:hypothetical protein